MSEKNKSTGSLRDFRIDAQGARVSLDAKGARVSVDAQGASSSAGSELKQQVVSRQATVKEWTYSQSPMAVENLWAEWSEEAKAPQQRTGQIHPSSGEIHLGQTPAQTAMQQPREQTRQQSREQSRQVSSPRPFKETLVPVKEGVLATESFHQLPWPARLALDERNMEKEGQVDFSSSYQKQEILRIRTREFAQTLQEAFRQNIEIFNESRKCPSHVIHVYKVSNAEGDFMLFRNGVKLVVSAQQSGRVIFAFNQFMGQIYAPTHNPVIEVEAAWGPFEQLFWSYRNERVQVSDLVRYFVTEFVKQSYR